MRANLVSPPSMPGRRGSVAEAARPGGRSAHGRSPIHLVAGSGMAIASVVIVLFTPTGGLWRAGACAGLLFASAVAWVARAATPTVAVRLCRRLDEADERLAAQSDELGRYAAILSSTHDAIVTVSPDGLITHWNPAATALYGCARDEVLGRSFATLGPELAPTIAEAMDEVLRGTPRALEIAHRRPDGSTVHASLVLSRMCDLDGRASGVVGIARDIGEQKVRDAESQQKSKLESLGRLSAGLAHEINSPIQFVGDNARFLEEAYQELIRVVEVYRGLLDTSNPIGWIERQERVREAEESIDFDYLREEIPSAVEQTLEGIERVSTIVRAMRTFSHQGHDEQVPADLNGALAATVTVTRRQVGEVADLVLDLADLPLVRCNIADLNQVFLNLILNAADAIEETGRRGVITVSTALDGEEVVVGIQDTGAGIPEEVRPKIFDPFFTTKDVGRGSGQGLPLARAVVQEGHGGTLEVESVRGEGSTFSVRLPVDGRAAQDGGG